MANYYPVGQCTWGVVEMCPCLGDLQKYGDFGNGRDWYAHAQQVGLPTSRNPRVGWLASFDVLPPLGHVALILSVEQDTITIYGANWRLDGAFSVDKAPRNAFIGCFQSPCACTGPSGQPIEAELFASSAGNCRTFSWSLFGGSVCFDGVIGVVALVGGVALAVAGLVIIAVQATQSSGGRQAVRGARITGEAAQTITRPIRRAPRGPRTTEETAASRQRVATARARAATRRGQQPVKTTRTRTATREEAMQALQENRPLTPEQARAIGATEVQPQ